MPLQPQRHPDSELLRSREVAMICGVRPATVARWSQEGRLACTLTPGGHRRYWQAEVRKILEAEGTALRRRRASTSPPGALKAQG
jgi:predicted site-specific integrase-resolvase